MTTTCTPKGLADRNVNAPQGWNPLCDRTANVEGEGCFTQPEILDVREKSKAAYLMLRFGGPEANLGSVNVVGNVGVRFVRTEVESHGQVELPDVAVVHQCAGFRTGRLRPGQQRRQPGDRHPVLADAGAAGVQQRHGHGQRARQGLHERVAELQRALRVHRHAVHAFRLLEGHVARGLRPVAKLGGDQCAAHRHQQQLAVSDPQRAGTGHRLQLRVLGRSGLRGPGTDGSRQLRPVVRVVHGLEQLVHRWACSTRSWKMPWPMAVPCATSRMVAAPRP